MSDIWKDWPSLYKACHNRPVVLFGRSDDWIDKNVRMFGKKAVGIVDNNKSLWGSSYAHLKIYRPSWLKSVKNPYIVISSGSYSGICKQLIEMGYDEGNDFCVTPYIKDLKVIDDIQEHNFNLLVSVPDHHNKRSKDKNRGGIYLFDSQEGLKQLIPGRYRQMTKANDYYFAIEHYDGLTKINSDFKIEKQLCLETNSQAHGVAYCPPKNLVFVANTGLDKITIHDGDTLKHLDDILFSDKIKHHDIQQHHINDLSVDENYLYVSYFSVSGNYRRGVFDGGISQYDLNDLHNGRTDIVSDLWFPHSVKIINNKMSYLDTMRGNFYVGIHHLTANFNGFLRGLDYDGKYYYIGQSVNTYASRLKGISNNIMLNAGIYLYDIENSVSIFYPIDGVIDIHDVIAL